MARLFLDETCGVLADLMEKLSGDSGNDWLAHLKRFLRRQEDEVSWLQATHIAYGLCGLSTEVAEALKTFNLKGEKEGVWRVLMVKGLTYDGIEKAYERAGLVLQTYSVNLQKVINAEKEQRCPDHGSYLVSFAANMEADEVNKNQSAAQRERAGCKDNTLLERLLMGLVVWLKGQGHLDRKTVTLCAGSRDSDGNVPRVSFDTDNGEVYVIWYSPDCRSALLRARSAEFPS